VPDSLGIGVIKGLWNVHDFTYVAQYESAAELAAILGRIYGPPAARYVAEREQSTLTTRQRIWYGRVVK
jgi:hypothetical protein